MRKIIVCLVSCLFFQSLVSMDKEVVAVDCSKQCVRIDSVEALRSIAETIKKDELWRYDIQPLVFVEYLCQGDEKMVKSRQALLNEVTWLKDKQRSRYFKLKEEVIDEIQNKKQSPLNHCLQQFCQMAAHRPQQLQQDIAAIEDDYQEKKNIYWRQCSGNALVGLTMVAAAVGIGLEIWTMVFYCHT